MKQGASQGASQEPLIDKSSLAAAGVIGGDHRVNVFIHGYRSMASDAAVARACEQIANAGAVGENYLLLWGAGAWRKSMRSMASTLTGLRAAYRVAQVRRVFAPWMILVDAGVVSLSEVAQFKLMENRAQRVGQDLPALLAEVARARPVNLIGHSLGARVAHYCLAVPEWPKLEIDDCVFLGGAADVEADNWPECLGRLSGSLFNAYTRLDPILRITPDLRRRVGGGPMPPVLIDGVDRVVNHRCRGVGHMGYWSQLGKLLPEVWDGCNRDA